MVTSSLIGTTAEQWSMQQEIQNSYIKSLITDQQKD